MIIKKAVLHILDFNSGVSVFSQQVLDFSDTSISEYLEKLIEHTTSDPAKKTGTFFENSQFATTLTEYIHNERDFLQFSTDIASFLYEQISLCDKLNSTDLIIADCIYESTTYFAIILLANKTAYTHQVINDEGGIHNDIIKHHAILPSPSQKPEAFALINTDNMEIEFFDKKVNIDGNPVHILPELLLECSSSISSKEVVKIVNEVTKSVAEEYGTNVAVAVSKAKNYIVENSEESDTLCPFDLAEEVFSDSLLMKEAFEKKIEEKNIPHDVKIEKQSAVKASKNHKIKTDTGIEITIPVEYFEDEKYLAFVNNPDGTISIELKNIGKIINK